MGDVVDAIDPIGQARIAEAGMRRRDHAIALAEQADIGVFGFEAAAGMEKEQRRAVAGFVKLELDIAEHQHLSLHRGAPFFFRAGLTHYFIAPPPRQGGAAKEPRFPSPVC